MVDVLRGVYNGDDTGEQYVKNMLSTALPLLRGMKLDHSRGVYATLLVKQIRELSPDKFDAAMQGIDVIQIESQMVSLEAIRSSGKPS